MQLYYEIKSCSYQMKMITPGGLLGQPALLSLVSRSAHLKQQGSANYGLKAKAKTTLFFLGPTC